MKKLNPQIIFIKNIKPMGHKCVCRRNTLKENTKLYCDMQNAVQV